MRFVLAILTLLTAFYSAEAQSIRDTKGTDFWVAFPPNDNENDSSSATVTVYVAADQQSEIEITSTDRDGIERVTQHTVVGGSIFQADFDVKGHQLRGATNLGTNRDEETPLPMSVHITSDVPVTCYASSRVRFSSDAWLVLPTHTLGQDYRVISYASDYEFRLLFSVSYPSQFVIIATEDSTDVTIDLSVGESSVSAERMKTVVLDRGECYLVQARVRFSSQNDDLTGSRVRASKPVAVLGSHFRAQIPIITQNATRDILVEQILPTDTWGKSFVVPPYELPVDYEKDGQNDVTVLRVLTSQDSTQISIDGTPPFMFARAGTTWDMPLTFSGRTVESTKPVLVAIFDRSANRNPLNEDFRAGDPSLTIVPPAEQYLNTYLVASIEPIPDDPFYTNHYLSITASLNASNSIIVDGVLAAPLTEIRNSGFGYVNVPVAAGPHTVSSDSTFGVIAYGYGPAESYGYTAGVALERLYQPSVRLRVLDAHGAPGDSVHLVIVVDTIGEEASFWAMGPTLLRGAIDYNRSMFVPRIAQPPSIEIRDSIQFEHRFDTLHVGDTVATIPGVIVLGSQEKDVVDAHRSEWLDGSDDVLTISTTRVAGLLSIDELCREGGRTRLFDPHLQQTTTTRIYDINGKHRAELAPGWNIVVSTSEAGVQTEKIFIQR